MRGVATLAYVFVILPFGFMMACNMLALGPYDSVQPRHIIMTLVGIAICATYPAVMKR